MVPVIINAVLNEHQLVIDIVAFVIKGDFHRSRLGEKQRGKILAGWVTRKMRTIAQYSIRDVSGLDNPIHEVAEPGGRLASGTFSGTFRNSGGPGSMKGSMRASSTLGMTAMTNLQLQTGIQELPAQGQMGFGVALPQGVSEMPGERYPESIPELGTETLDRREGGDDTPTELKKDFPLDEDAAPYLGATGLDDGYNHQQYGATGLSTVPLPDILRPGPREDMPPEPQYGNKPYLNFQDPPQHQAYQYHSLEDGTQQSEQWPLGPRRSVEEQGQRGSGLRVANASRASTDDEQDTAWKQEALMTMNFAGSGPESIGRFS